MAKFFEHGEVETVCSDHLTRQAAIRVSAPWCVVQAAIAILLGHGFIDSLCVKHPLIAWTPPIPKEHFHETALIEAPNIPERVSKVLQDRVVEMLQLFADLASILKNPDDALGLLPMSVYVTFQFRSTYENLAEVVCKLEPFGTPGVSELRFALASVLAEMLASAGSVETLALDAQGVPALLGSPMTADAAGLATPASSAQGQNSFGQNGRE